MSEYAERRIKEALKIAKGNALKARKYVVEWALEDERLLKYLVGPHLNGIVAYNVERVASGRSEKARSLEPLAKKIKGKNTKEKSGEKFGMEILKAVVDQDATIFGFEDRPARRKGASEDHVEAIRKLASTRKKTKKDK